MPETVGSFLRLRCRPGCGLCPGHIAFVLGFGCMRPGGKMAVRYRRSWHRCSHNRYSRIHDSRFADWSSREVKPLGLSTVGHKTVGQGSACTFYVLLLAAAERLCDSLHPDNMPRPLWTFAHQRVYIPLNAPRIFLLLLLKRQANKGPLSFFKNPLLSRSVTVSGRRRCEDATAAVPHGAWSGQD